MICNALGKFDYDLCLPVHSLFFKGGGGVEGGWRVWGKFGGNKYLIAQRAPFGFPENIERWYLPE